MIRGSCGRSGSLFAGMPDRFEFTPGDHAIVLGFRPCSEIR